MSLKQSAVTSFGIDIDREAPLWARVDAQSSQTDTTTEIVDIASGERSVPDIAADYEAFTVGYGTGTSLHAPVVVTTDGDGDEELARRCDEGHGGAAKPREFEQMVGWRSECTREECQHYFDALEAAGVIDR